MTDSGVTGRAQTAADDGLNPAMTSIVADKRKPTLNGVLVGAVAVLLVGAVFYLKNAPSGSAVKAVELPVTTAPRKPVPELKAETEPVEMVLPVAETPAAPYTDSLQLFRDQQEWQRAEKARLLLEARLKSALDPGDGTGPPVAGILPGAQQFSLDSKPADRTAEQAGSGPQDLNSRFARSVSGTAVPSSKASSLTNPDYKILQGKAIEAITLPRAVSDLPGTICAMTQRDVYAERGRLVLIPWGSRLCGVYNADLRKGQNRLFTIWNTVRVANPDGSISEVLLDSAGADQLGSSGMGGLVDTHFAEIFGTSALLSIIGAGAATMGVTGNDQNLSANQYRLSVQQAAAQTAQSVLTPYVTIPPTITVPAGSRIRIFVNRDLDFSAVFQSDRTALKPAAESDFFE